MATPTVKEQILDSVVRLETQEPDGKHTGTGFFYRYRRANPALEGDFLVTNRHMVEHAESMGFPIREAAAGGASPVKIHRVNVPDPASVWTFHPSKGVDLACLNLGTLLTEAKASGTEFYYRAIPPEIQPTREAISLLDSVEEVLFVGYPNDIYDTVNLRPLVRRAITASSAKLDFQGKPIYIIDGAVFPGSSGSPVFIAQEGGWSDAVGLQVGSRVMFMGVVSHRLWRTVTGQLSFEEVPTALQPIATFREGLNLGVVQKPGLVTEVIESVGGKAGGAGGTSSPAGC